MERIRVFSSLAMAVTLALAGVALGGCPVRGPICGDGVCQMGEGNCLADCSGTCGNGTCEATETATNCAQDCAGGPVCGDGTCEAPENNGTCPGDCPPTACGNGVCEVGETMATCPGDCTGGAVCGNGVCEAGAGENAGNCPGDCGGAVCGNGTCDAGESIVTCPGDCGGTGPVCGNGVCQVGESMTSCPVDCPAAGVCGDGSVDVGEECDPPNGITCDSSCMLFTMTGPANMGAACSVDSNCSSGGAGLPVLCLTEAGYEWPGGYCLIYDCTIDSVDGTDDCPGASHCEAAFSDGMGGFIYACLPDCTPSTTGLGGCRSTTTTDYAYTCRPDIIDPLAGGCWLGCNTADPCNWCDTATSLCNDDITSCVDDADCQAAANYACSTTINACYPDHTAGTASVGDPCTDDLDCPANSLCVEDATVYPGGLCTVFYCESYAGVVGFGCPAGSVCPATAGFFGGQFQMCTDACTIGGSPSCDSARGDSFGYDCIETINPMTSLTELFDTTGAAGFCFQCEGLFGTDPACP